MFLCSYVLNIAFHIIEYTTIFQNTFPMIRRHFIKDVSLAAAGITILNFPVFGKNAPSNKVVLAVSGVNSRGSYLAKCYSQLPNVEIAYICDVEEKAIANGLDALKDAPRKPTVV